ncbi:MAG: four helix bundle protein [Patescibacteria group bacterium]
MEKTYVSLEHLEAYKLARKLSKLSWELYEIWEWRIKKIMGDQFIESVDSVGANIAEGYGRFHYLDKVKFYYNARGSLLEFRHWLDVLSERNLIDKIHKADYLNIYKELRMVLNGLINGVMRAKDRELRN